MLSPNATAALAPNASVGLDLEHVVCVPPDPNEPVKMQPAFIALTLAMCGTRAYALLPSASLPLLRRAPWLTAAPIASPFARNAARAP